MRSVGVLTHIELRPSAQPPVRSLLRKRAPCMRDTSNAWRIMGSERRAIVTTTRIVAQRTRDARDARDARDERHMCHFTVAVSVRGSPGMLYRSALPCAAMK